MTAALAPAAAPATPRCFSIVGTRGIRATLLDACGRPVFGPQSQVVTSGVVSIEFEPEVEEGEEYNQATASGEQCFPAFKGPDTVKWWTVTMEFCLIDPDLYLALNRNWKRVTDYTGQVSTGWRMGTKISDTLGFALETWPKAAPGGGAAAACLDAEGNMPDDFEPGGYFLLPWVVAQAPDSWTLENEPSTFTLKARTRGGSLWGRGPYNVVRDEHGNAAPLHRPIDPGFDVPTWNLITDGDPDHFHGELTSVRPPTSQCGAQPLWNPRATGPKITVTADADDPRTAVLEVGNLDQVGNRGTVQWGDDQAEPVTPESGGTLRHTYASALHGTPVTVTFTAGNGSAPVTAEFTPNAPSSSSSTGSASSRSKR